MVEILALERYWPTSLILGCAQEREHNVLPSAAVVNK